MNKILISLAVIGALSLGQISIFNINTDSPNEKVNYKKTSAEQNVDTSETSILVEDTITPSCKCEEGKCQRDKKNNKETNESENSKLRGDKKEDCKKQTCPREDKNIEKNN